MKRLLVTGGAGFIGANFCRYWTATYPSDRIVILDALTYAGNLASIEDLIRTDGVRFVRGDIGDRALVAQLLTQEQIDWIINFAAESHVDRSIEDPQRFFSTNVMGTQALLEAVRSVWRDPTAGARRFHHVSTDEVYGSLGLTDPAFTERTPYSPNSPYAASKAAADHLVRAYGQTYGVACTISNCSNNYGPYQFPEKLLPLCIVNILESRALPIYGDGLQIRDWLHVGDHCRAIDLILRTSPVGETWNVGGGGSAEPNIRLVEAVCDLVDEFFSKQPELATRFPSSAPALGRRSRTLIKYVRDRPGHDRRYAVDFGKITNLGFVAQTPLADGLAATVWWYLENERWWRSIATGEYRQWYARQYGEAS